jgi:hypothetical protein
MRHWKPLWMISQRMQLAALVSCALEDTSLTVDFGLMAVCVLAYTCV